MTGDVGEYFNDLKEIKKAKKESNLESSTRILEQKGIDFDSCNGGVHLIVRRDGKTVDFWPSTGKWIVRKESRKGRGIFKLLRYLQIS